MRIFLRTLLFTLPAFLSPLVNLLRAIFAKLSAILSDIFSANNHAGILQEEWIQYKDAIANTPDVSSNDVSSNNTLTPTTTNSISDDAKQCDASFSFFSTEALCVVELVPVVNNIKKKIFTKTKALNISRDFAMLLLVNFVFTQFTYAIVTGPGISWQFCRKATLSPATPSANFQVKITLAAGQYGNMNATGNDLRFYDINNNPCNYWIETWNNVGASTIWVKVPTSGATALYMYYGNAAAPATSNGANVFDFFDDFTTALGANWSTITSGGSVTQSGTTVTLSNTNAGTVSLSNTSAFTPSSSSFLLETKHQEAKYNRNRFYATNSVFGANPIGFDNGYFNSGGTAANTAQVFWNGVFGATVNVNTNYLSQWQITDGSTYTWKTFTYPAMALVQTNTATYNNSDIRFISISVTEVAATSTIIDWVRVRKFAATEPVAATGNQVTNISAGITAQTNVFCNGQSTGSATVTATGGGTPYSYSWNSSPAQSTQTATSLPIGTYIATVTENSIGISATATAIITQAATINSTVTSQSNVICFNTNNGQIVIAGSGGTSPYTYSVNNGTSYQVSNTFNGLSSGTYKIRIKDSNGCQSRLIQ